VELINVSASYKVLLPLGVLHVKEEKVWMLPKGKQDRVRSASPHRLAQ
jgi:hypothetical protein